MLRFFGISAASDLCHLQLGMDQFTMNWLDQTITDKEV